MIIRRVWVSTKDRLPIADGRYLVCINRPPYQNNYIKIASFARNLEAASLDFKYADGYCRSGFYNADGEGAWEETDVTHWMSLPEPPNQPTGNGNSAEETKNAAMAIDKYLSKITTFVEVRR